MNYTVIENPSVGKTYYHEDQWGVYKYDTYPRGSVLAGQERRSLLGQYDSLKEAKAAYPEAEVSGGSEYQEVQISHEPPGWFDPAEIGERWDDDY